MPERQPEKEPKDRVRAGLDSLVRARAGIPETEAFAMRTEIGGIDHLTRGGLRLGDVSVIGARTGIGKSALAEQIALAVSARHKTHYFALELGYRMTENRMLGKLLGWDLHRVTGLRQHHPDDKALLGALEALTYEHDLLIEERDRVEDYTSRDLIAAIVASSAKFVIVDHPRHLDDWTPTGAHGRSDLSPAGIVKRLLAVAAELHIHILIVAQTKAEYLKGRKPLAYDLADTFTLAQVASTVIMLHRPFQGQSGDGVAELIVDKNRHGPEGICHTKWVGRTMSFLDFTPDEEREAIERCCKPKKSTYA
jgi:replicative DNA helicase